MEPKSTTKLIIVVIITILVIGAGVYYVTSREVMAPEVGVNTADTTSYSNGPLDLAFEHPETYIAIAPSPLPGDVMGAVTLFDKDDYEELQNSTEPREGPLAITIEVFPNPQDLSAAQWVTGNAARVNYNPVFDVHEPVLVAGVSGLRYAWTGLYEGESVVVPNRNRVYVFSYTWMSADDPIKTDFEALLRTVKLD